MSETDMKKLFDKAVSIVLEPNNMKRLETIATYSKPLSQENIEMGVNETNKFVIVDIGIETTNAEKVREALESIISDVPGMVKDNKPITEQSEPPQMAKDILSSAMGSLGFLLPKIRDKEFTALIKYVFSQKEGIQYKVVNDKNNTNVLHYKIKITFKNDTDMDKVKTGLQKVVSIMLQVYNMALQQ